IFTTVQNLLNHADERPALFAEHQQRIAENNNTIADLTAHLTQAEALNDPTTAQRLTDMETEIQELRTEDAINQDVLADLRRQLRHARKSVSQWLEEMLLPLPKSSNYLTSTSLTATSQNY